MFIHMKCSTKVKTLEESHCNQRAVHSTRLFFKTGKPVTASGESSSSLIRKNELPLSAKWVRDQNKNKRESTKYSTGIKKT